MNASDIEVTTFRQILLLPLTLTGVSTGVADAVKGFAAQLEGRTDWSEQKDHLAYLGSADDKAAYAEFVYFHPYIQDFLYDRGDDAKDGDDRPLRLFRRADPGQLQLRINVKGSKPGESGAVAVDITLPICRMNLYFFELGIIILAVEVAIEMDPKVQIDGTTHPMSLAHAQALQNALRRVYPPYFLDRTVETNDPDDIPEYPASLRWSGGEEIERRRPKDWIAHVARHRRNPVDPVWKQILAPLPVEESSADTATRLRQIVDERIPCMSFIGVRDTSAVPASDFVRLCFLDDPGEGYPYATSFLKDFEREHCYDRFWDGTSGTRYLFSGYSMVVVGCSDPADKKDFFRNTLATHFRRHYFQMGLLIQLQFAALLSLSHRISEAVQHKKGDGGGFRSTMLEIEDAVLAFEQRYWFTQVSNQLQAREIYDLWLKRIGVVKIYSEVREQVHAANTYLDAREQAAQTSAATRLSVVATFGVVVAASLAFLGMNVLASPDFLAAFGVPKDLASVQATAGSSLSGSLRFAAAHLAAFFAVLTGFSVLGRVLLGRYSRSSVPRGRVKGDAGSITVRLNHDLACLAVVSFVLTLLLVYLLR